MKRIALFAAALAVTAATAAAQDKKAKTADPFDFPAPPLTRIEQYKTTVIDGLDAGIDLAIRKLGSPEHSQRTHATRALFAQGERARAALEAARERGNAERRNRVKQLLAWLDRAKKLKASNANVMLRGYCMAKGDKPDENALGGHYQDQNASKAITPDLAKLAKEGKVSLVARPGHLARWGKENRGMQLWLVNRTGKGVAFAAQDSRLNIRAEAKDTDGTWKPIEYLPSSW